MPHTRPQSVLKNFLSVALLALTQEPDFSAALFAQVVSQTQNFIASPSTFAEPFPITTHPEADLMPALSPDGKWLAYVSRANKNYDLWVKPAAGGLATPLTTHTSDDYSPTWAPDGKALAFISRRDDAEGDLYWLELKYGEGAITAGKTQLLRHNLQREAYPAFSPDGKKIAFSLGPAGAEQIWIYEIKTQAKYPLTKLGGTQPAWSPDGKQLAIASSSPNSRGQQIFIISADSTSADRQREQITFAGDNGFPSWSPDGQKILVQRFEVAHSVNSSLPKASRTAHLCIISLATRAELQITPSRSEALFPFWGNDHALYYAAPFSFLRATINSRGHLDVWRLPETGLFPPQRTAQESFAAAQRVADPEIARLAFAALRFYFPDSTLWGSRAELESGRCYLLLGDTLQAKSIWTQMTKVGAGSFEAAAFAEIELAKLARDIKQLAAISERRSTWPAVQAWGALETGKALQDAGEPEAALRYLQKIPAQYPDLQEVCYEALRRAGDILMSLNRTDAEPAEAAEAAYLQIVTNYREHETWQATATERLLGAALRRTLTSDTLAVYQRVAQKYSAYPAVAHTARFRIAERLWRDGEIKLAKIEYGDLIALLETQPDAYLQTLRAESLRGLMRLHIFENDFPPAVQVYAKMFAAYSTPAEKNAVHEARAELTAALIQRARLLVRQRDFELALALFQQARRFDPQNVEAQRGYMETKYALGDIDEAIAEYEKAYPAFARFAPSPNENHAPNEVALYALGLAYSYKGENHLGLLRHSTALIERALRINYQLLPAYLTLGFNYEAMEKLEQKERERKKGFFETMALVVPDIIDRTLRTITFRGLKPPARWYEKAIDVLTIAIALNDENRHPQLEANIALNLANNYYNLGEYGYEYALQYFQHKLRYDSAFVSPRQQAVIFERIGECAWVTRRYDEAIPFLQTALKLCRELRDVDGELRNLNRLALVYQSKGDYETSNEQFAKVDTVSRRENRRENLPLVWRNMALNHQQNKESDEAITKSVRSSTFLAQRGKATFPAEKKDRLSIKLFDVLPIFWMTIDPFGESNTAGLTYEQEKALLFSIIGESYVAAKDFANAIETFEQKAEAFRQKKNLAGEARALNNLGLLWYSYHDFTKAYDYFARSYNLCARLQVPAGKIINVINMGNIALLTGEARRAHTVDSLLQASQSDIAQIGLQTPRQKLAVLNTLGNLYLRAAQNLFSPPPDSAPAGFGGDIERSYHALQNLGRARAAYDSALAVAQSQWLPRDEIIVRRNLASLFLLSLDHALALEQLQTAHDICIARNFGDLTWRVKHALGTLCRFVQVPPQNPVAGKSASDWYREAIQILESLPEEPEGSEQRLAETAEQNTLYENAITLLADQAQPRAALELAERNRSNRFIQLISTRYILPKKERQRLYWGGAGGLALDVQRRLGRLRGELLRLEAEALPRPKEIKRTRDELAAAEGEYRNIVQGALAEDPEFASFFNIQPLATQALQDSLDSETAILEYFVAENELIVWLLTRERLEQTRVPIARRHLQALVARLRESWSERRADEETLGRELSALLLGGVRDLDSFQRLLIVPDDCLHYLPFSALEYDGERVLDLFAVGKIPSLLALNFAALHQSLNENNLLVLQDPGANEAAAKVADTGGYKMQALPAADWHADEVRQKLQLAGLLHVQNRFTAQAQRPLDSGFRLQATATDTAVFPLYRLFEFDLSASLVALENTNFPFVPGQAGDELVALQRSLIYAGTPTLVYAQWPVAPKIRELFFNAFYQNLTKQPALAALHAAQNAVREQFPDPQDWAGFELSGFPGMSAAEKNTFAERHFKETVLSGNEAQELGEFSDAVRYYQAALTMAQQLGDAEAVQNLYLLIKASALSGNDYAAACEVETKILEGALAANDIRQTAQSYRNLSAWQMRLKNYATALEVEKKYLALAERVKNPLAVAESHRQQARILEASGDYVAALGQAQQAADILRQQNQILPRFAEETFLGKLALEADRYEEALAYLEKAVQTFLAARQPESAAEQRALATAYQLTGSVYSRLTAYGEALKFHQQALQIFEAIGDTANFTLAEQNLADAGWFNGDYQTALFHQQRALRLADEARAKLRGHSTLGLILLSLGDFDGALAAEKRALQFALETAETREQATIHKNLGLVYVQRQEHPQALASFRQATELDRQTGFERGLLYDYLFLGQTFQALAQPDSALAYLAKAETPAQTLNDRRAQTKTLYFKGLALIARGNKTLARAAFAEALAKAEVHKLDEMQWRCLWKLGALARQSGDLPPALDFYQRAITALERQSAKIKIEEYRSGFIDDKSEIYEETVLLLLQMNRPAEAFAIAERAKSRSFADQLANANVDLPGSQNADRELLNRREHLLDRLSLVQGKINALQENAGNPESNRLTIAALNDTLAQLQKEYSDVLVALKAANPELADLVSVEPLPLAELQTMLPDSTALVEYFFARDRLVSWVVDRRQARAVNTALDRQQLQENIAQLRRAITKRASTESFSRALYDQLLKPLEPLLASAKQLVIVPHGVLHYLPFPALQKADSTYLIDHYALALAPSATVLGFCYRKADSQPRVPLQNFRILALGNPAVGNARFDLPFAEKEIKSITQTFGAITSFERRQATTGALLTGAAQANLIHLSCHGVYDERNPLFSALLLAPDSTNPTGRLEAHKIFGLKLNASLVMLSACETGLARVTGGDEVIGLGRGFIFAGTPSLIASLWTVDDLATAITVKRFYRYLYAGVSKAEALRQAQRFVRDHHNRHPAYWASFGLTGDWR